MTISRNISIVFGFISSVALTLACGSDSDSDNTQGSADAGSGGTGAMTGGSDSGGAEPTIVDVAVKAGSFTTLVGAVQDADLVDALSGEGPFTVFAPDDAAFDAFETANPGVLASLSTEELTGILTYHVVGAEVRSADLVDGSIAETLSGDYVAVDLSDGVRVAGARVTAADIEASNGVIHVIDQVILPPADNLVETAVAAGSFTQLADALVATGLDETLASGGPFTVFAPTDDAFDMFEEENPGVLSGLSTDELTDILLYHVVDGWVGAADLEDGATVPTLLPDATVSVDLSSGAMINNSTVTTANIIATNGVIHVIDEILLPPAP